MKQPALFITKPSYQKSIYKTINRHKNLKYCIKQQQ